MQLLQETKWPRFCENLILSGSGMGFFQNFSQSLAAHMSVNLSGGEAGVPQQLLDRSQIGPVVYEMRGISVAESVGVCVRSALHYPPQVACGERVSCEIEE